MIATSDTCPSENPQYISDFCNKIKFYFRNRIFDGSRALPVDLAMFHQLNPKVKWSSFHVGNKISISMMTPSPLDFEPRTHGSEDLRLDFNYR